MINLSYRFDQNSSSLEIEGLPDVSSDDSAETIGILSSWTLRIIGSPLLEGKKEHLDNLMQVTLRYSRAYVSGIRTSVKSPSNIVCITPFGKKHKFHLNSTQKDVRPLEIILDDSELSDLTRCFDLIRYDERININWKIDIDKPFKKSYILSKKNNSSKYLSFVYSFIVFVFISSILIFIPIKENTDDIKNDNYSLLSK